MCRSRMKPEILAAVGAAALALFVLECQSPATASAMPRGSRILHRRSKKSGTDSNPDDGGNDGREIFEVETIKVATICGTLREVKDDFETALLSFYRTEFDECDSDRYVISVNLVQFEEAPICDDVGEASRLLSGGNSTGGEPTMGNPTGGEPTRRRKRSKAKLNKRSTCKMCDRRLHELPLLGREVEMDLTVAGNGYYIGSSTRPPHDLVRSKKKKKSGSGESKTPKGGKDRTGKFSKNSAKSHSKNQSRQSCDEADLTAELQAVGFKNVTEAKITETKEVDCSLTSRECHSPHETKGACCGVDGCACPTVSSSICMSQGCCIEGMLQFDPCVCQYEGECGKDPCQLEQGTCTPKSPTFPPLSSTPTISPSSFPTYTDETMSSIMSCIAVIDENDAESQIEVEAKWTEFRSTYPNRQFCLLQPYPSSSELYIPGSFFNDTKTVFSQVNRDEGDLTKMSDWFEICDLLQLSPSISTVAVFVDSSGSMTLDTVGASLTHFKEKAAAAGLDMIVRNNTQEDYITPFLTFLA